MSPAELLGAVMVLVASGVLGILAHEFAHALALRAFGIAFRIDWLPDGREEGLLGMIFLGKLAAVTPTRFPHADAALRLRISSMMPLALLVPLATIPLGVVPGSLVADSLFAKVALIGWCACALPSPQDFSVLWYAPRVVAKKRAARKK
ncbi:MULTISPECIES: hypothetical protein [unclassified Haladaptatus]|uniref:hypothetical protein n=1 Tax=unclassified Haladaptatus TaxID=2622732 RepID=UPI0023E865CE|nr:MULTISPECIES: hypothetical protein [unclassified Haladaptatus]